jgi:hypothetical protein
MDNTLATYKEVQTPLHDDAFLIDSFILFLQYKSSRRESMPSFHHHELAQQLRTDRVQYVLREVVAKDCSLWSSLVSEFLKDEELYSKWTSVSYHLINGAVRKAFVDYCRYRLHRVMGVRTMTTKAIAGVLVECSQREAIHMVLQNAMHKNKTIPELKNIVSPLMHVTTVAIVETGMSFPTHDMFVNFVPPDVTEFLHLESSDDSETLALLDRISKYKSETTEGRNRLLSVYDVCNVEMMKWLDHREAMRAPLFQSKYIGEVVGIKADGYPTLGFFRKTRTRADLTAMLAQEEEYTKSGDATEGDRLSDGTHFKNCITLNIVLDTSRVANVKLFHGGRLQLTGIPRDADGRTLVQYLEQWLCRHHPGALIPPSTTTQEQMPVSFIKKYTTTMINTTFNLGFSICRERVKLILEHVYNLRCTYDTEGYQGVHIYYYVSDNSTSGRQGVCTCSTLCMRPMNKTLAQSPHQQQEGGGDGAEPRAKRRRREEVSADRGKCKVITIALFQSGRAIVATGNGTLNDVVSAYQYLASILVYIRPLISKAT